MHCWRESTKYSKAAKAVSLVWDFWSERWILATANNTVAIVMANPIRKGYGGRIWDHTEKSSFDNWIHFHVFSGDHSLWSTDAGCDICGGVNWDIMCQHFRSCRSFFIRFIVCEFYDIYLCDSGKEREVNSVKRRDQTETDRCSHRTCKNL